jgi:predicted HicB family RNase H-like nuclease
MQTKRNAPKVALAFARQTAKTARSWVDFHNALFGIGGKCTELFPTEADRVAFAKTGEYREVQQLLEQVRDRTGDAAIGTLAANANGTVIVRMPRSLHAALLAEAKAEDVSLNQLCVAKLSMQLGAVVRSA